MADCSVTNNFSAGTTIVASQINTNYSDIVNFINNRNSASASWSALGVTGNASIGGTLVVTGAATLSSTLIALGGLKGTTTNDNATALYVGELITNATVRSSPITTVASTAKTVTSIVLTAGDWDVRGAVGWRTAATTTVFSAGINTSTNTLPSGDTYANFSAGQGIIQIESVSIVISKDYVIPIPSSRVSISGTTTIYLVQSSDQANSAYGYLEGRRRR